MQTEITRDVARRVLEVVDQGLVNGPGVPEPGKLCVEAAVCYALGLPHGDDPKCVSAAVRALKIRLNDSRWSSNHARAKGLRRLALAQLGSVGAVDDREFARRAAEMTIRTVLPRALRAVVGIQKDPKHRYALIAAAVRCEKEGTKNAAYAAAYAAYAAYAAAYAAADAAAYAAAHAAADAAAYAAAHAAAYAAADAAAYAAADAAAAAYAADAAARAAAADADRELSAFAESVVGILIEMNAPGCQWLDLAPVSREG